MKKHPNFPQCDQGYIFNLYVMSSVILSCNFCQCNWSAIDDNNNGYVFIDYMTMLCVNNLKCAKTNPNNQQNLDKIKPEFC